MLRYGADEGTVPAFGLWDALSYTYNGNQLLKVADTSPTGPHKNLGFKDGTNTGDDYIYDDNGNMIKDNNKNIMSITYNHLNLPKLITIAQNDHTGTIEYVYDATGVKLQKIVNPVLDGIAGPKPNMPYN